MDRAAAERGAHDGPGEWSASPAAAVSMPGGGAQVDGAQRDGAHGDGSQGGGVQVAAAQVSGAPGAYRPPAAATAVATPMAPAGPYPTQVYGAPPPPAPSAAGLPVGLPAGSPVPARNPYAPPPRGGARPTYGPLPGNARPTSGPPGPGAAPTPSGVPGAPSSSGPRVDPGARYVDPTATPTRPHSFAEQYGYGYDTDGPAWAGGAAARPVGSGTSIAAFVLAAIALFVLPPFVGAAAIVLAAFAIRRGERLGRAALVTSILCLAGGVTLGVLSYTAGIPGF